MPDQDWTAGPYARVYADLADRHPEVWEDAERLAWYVKLLLPADRAWPVPMPWPMGIPGHVQAALVDLGAVDALPGGRYQVHGMARLQGARADYHQAGGVVRARNARRDHLGRMLGRDAGPDAGPPSVDAGRNAGTGVLDSPGEPMLDVQESSTDAGKMLDVQVSSTETYTNGVEDPSLQSGSSTPPRETIARPPAREAAPEPDPDEAAYRYAVAHFGPDASPCDLDDPSWDHRVRAHMFWHGVGWRCRDSEQADPRSFRDRMEAHGGPHF